MKTYQVTISYDLEVEAENEEEAIDIAWNSHQCDTHPEPTSFDVEENESEDE